MRIQELDVTVDLVACVVFNEWYDKRPIPKKQIENKSIEQ